MFLPPDSFIQDIHFALQNLYDPVVLLKSRLVVLLKLESRPNPGLALQDLITSSIEALRPRLDVPLHSNAWRLFNVLTLRFVEQSSQSLVADTLGLSVRQLRRHEKGAEQLLSEFIWKSYHLADSAVIIENEQNLNTTDEHIKIFASQEDELVWLKESIPDTLADVAELIKTTITTINPVILKNGINIFYHIGKETNEVTGPVSIMRQTLINLMLGMVNLQGCTLIDISHEFPDQTRLIIKITTNVKAENLDTNQIDDYLSMAKNLARLFDGEITSLEIPTYEVSLLIPLKEKIPVLFVDDNADTLQLFQRYLSGSNYQFYGVQNPDRALNIALEIKPKVVLMDVMMPGMDEWELLGRFRNHPEFEKVPVVICTILPHEELALALGATGFIRKPVIRQAFLSVLDQQINRDWQTHR